MNTNKVGIIGAGRFGLFLAESLVASNVDVTLMDRNWDIINSLEDSEIRAIYGDGTNPENLREAGFADCDTVVIAISSSMECSTLATMNCKDMKIPSVIAKASSDLHGRILERIGADIVVYPERDRAYRLAKTIISEAPVDFFEIAAGYNVAEINVPKNIVDKSIIEANVRQKFGMTILAIRRTTEDGKGPRQTIIPTGQEILEKDDLLLVFSSEDNLKKLYR